MLKVVVLQAAKTSHLHVLFYQGVSHFSKFAFGFGRECESASQCQRYSSTDSVIFAAALRIGAIFGSLLSVCRNPAGVQSLVLLVILAHRVHPAAFKILSLVVSVMYQDVSDPQQSLMYVVPSRMWTTEYYHVVLNFSPRQPGLLSYVHSCVTVVQSGLRNATRHP